MALLPYVGAIVLLVWETAHLFPTRQAVAGFGELSGPAFIRASSAIRVDTPSSIS